MTDTPPPEVTIADRDKAIEVLDRLHAVFRQHIESTSSAVHLGFDLNKQTAAFYERLMLLDLGTLALSVNALISLFQKEPFGHGKIHQPILLTLVIVAWTLLLASTFLCRVAMVESIQGNKKMSDNLQRETAIYRASMLNFVLALFPRVVRGKIIIADQERDFKEVTDELRGQAQAIMRANSQKANEKEVKQPYAMYKLAVTFMQIALILLGVVAVKLLLSLS